MQRTSVYVLKAVPICIVAAIPFLFDGNAYLDETNEAKLTTDKRGSIRHAATPTQSRNYKDTLAKLEAERLKLASRYQSASPVEGTALIAEARALLTRAIYDDLFPAWYGTPWDFNGTSETPQQGKIACGYFVSTVLRDAGWKVERMRLAQQASENIILSLTTDAFVKRFRRVSLDHFVEAVEQWGPGIYIVGLDIHVGFIVNIDNEVLFVHSSYVEPYSVVQEKASESRILASSNYRVLGKVLADDQLISNWLAGRTIPTRVFSRN